MTDPLTFRCTQCGSCCKRLRVALTIADLARLAHATAAPAHELVHWLGSDEVDLASERRSVVELSGGRRLMVLAQRDGACVHLDHDNRCSVYAARPLDCQAYPFDVTVEANGKRRLALLALDACDHASDGAQDRAALERTDATRSLELERHQGIVARWNRLAWHRRRLGRSVGSTEDFLFFALTQSDAN